MQNSQRIGPYVPKLSKTCWLTPKRTHPHPPQLAGHALLQSIRSAGCARARTPPAPLAADGRDQANINRRARTSDANNGEFHFSTTTPAHHQFPGTHWRPEDDRLHHLLGGGGGGRAEVVVLPGERRERLVVLQLQQRPRPGLAGPVAGRRRHEESGGGSKARRVRARALAGRRQGPAAGI